MQGNGFTDEASTLMTPIGSQGRAKEPKYTSIPKALEAAANKEAARACFDCVKSVTETPDEGDCKDEKAERVSTVSPRFVDGVLKASWALLVPVPVGVCRETDDHMFIYVESDTLPAEWGVPTTPAIVTKALAEAGSATLSKSTGSMPTGSMPMGWTEVTPEAAAAGPVAKVFGR
jgi:hypothetical protein